MIYVVATLTIKPETRAEFIAAATACIKETRKEPGNIAYDLHESVTDPAKMVFVEQWENAGGAGAASRRRAHEDVWPRRGEMHDRAAEDRSHHARKGRNRTRECMIRATEVKGQHRWTEAPADTVVLDFDDRHRRRMAMTGTRGLEFLLDLENAVALRGGDALVLEDGRLIEVVAAAEPLLEIRGPDPLASGSRRLASRQPPSADADHAKGPAHPPGSRHRGDGEGAWRAHHRDRGAVRSRRRRVCEQSRHAHEPRRACTCRMPWPRSSQRSWSSRPRWSRSPPW